MSDTSVTLRMSAEAAAVPTWTYETSDSHATGTAKSDVSNRFGIPYDRLSATYVTDGLIVVVEER